MDGTDLRKHFAQARLNRIKEMEQLKSLMYDASLEYGYYVHPSAGEKAKQLREKYPLSYLAMTNKKGSEYTP